MLTAFANCYKDLENLQKFHASTLYAVQQTEELACRENASNEPLIIPDSLSIVERPIFFRLKEKHANSRRRALNEVVYVRIISILEVYLIDSLQDIFAATKVPFKNGTEIKFSQSELLSISQEDLFDKIITKECRKLSSGGFKEVVKYYKKNLSIDLSSIPPGFSKMEEYHDKRHLLVHRLGQTDNKYRKKHSTEEKKIQISTDFINQIFLDIYSFSKAVNRSILNIIKEQEDLKPLNN